MNKLGKKLASNHSNFPKIILTIIIPIAAALVLLFPFITSNLYIYRVVTMIGVYAMLALSLNLVTGYMGIISMGHAAFYAIGAYIASLLTIKLSMNFFLAAILGAAGAGVSGLLLGLPTLRLTGAYLVMATVGFGEVVKMVVLNWDKMTNGALGIKNIPKPKLFGMSLTIENGGMYYLMLISLAIVMLICSAIKYSKMGRALRAIKDDELAVSMMGVNVNWYKVLTFVISSIIAGYVGAFYASLMRYIDPNTFTADTSTLILCVVLLGGMGSIWGMVLGAMLLISFPEVMRFLMEFRFIVYGLVLIVMMRFKPEGLLGRLSKKPYKLPKGVVAGMQGGEFDGNA